MTEAEAKQQLAEWKRRAETAEVSLEGQADRAAEWQSLAAKRGKQIEALEVKLLTLRLAAQEVLLDLQGRKLPISRERERELLLAVEAAR